jgi:DNA invertase Pin-like site-specific DNA recombinase
MESAVALERVSTRRQRPGLQSAPIRRHAEERGYDIARTVTIKASSYKGTKSHQEALDEVLEGARRGEWSVVLVVALDRVERRGVFHLQSWIMDLHRAGCRVESTSPGEEWLSDTSDELMWSIRLSMEADRARRESVLKSERVHRGFADKDRLGQGRYCLRLGWRYESDTDSMGRSVRFTGRVVADEGAQDAVRKGIALVADGGTLGDMSKLLSELGYPRSEIQCGAIVRAMEYTTGKLYVPSEVVVDPVVDPKVQLRAIAALDRRRAVAQRGQRNMTDRDFSGRIFCVLHESPLYRMPRRNGKFSYWTHNRCDCGTVRGPEAHAAIEKLMTETANWEEYETVSTGYDPSLELAEINAEIRRTADDRKPGWLDELAKLEARETQLKATQGTTERVRTGRHVSDVWKGLDITGKRRYLQRMAEQGEWKVCVARDSDGNALAVLGWQSS